MFNIDYPQEIHPERLLVVNKIGVVNGKIVLDIGCGKHKTISEAIGIDIMPCTDINCSGDALPFDQESVDIVISRHSLEHFIDTIKTLNEWRRVLKIGGRLMIVLPDHSTINTLSPLMNAGDHYHVFTPESFRLLIKSVGGWKTIEAGVGIPHWSFYYLLEKIML